MKKLKKSVSESVRIKQYALILALIWSAVLIVSLALDVYQSLQRTYEAARIQARASFMKDVTYRRWNAGHGGVYVPVTEKTRPNPYLDVAERDLTTHSGITLTLMNPAFMTRQVHELAHKEFGIMGHITSLNPIRPANAPDPWENQALESIRHGAEEVASIEKVNGKEYMRLIRPLMTEEGCLKCHASQGYKIGDIRGGISVSVPMSPLWAIARSHIVTFSLGYAFLYIFGLTGLILGTKRLNKQVAERKMVEMAVQKHTHDLEERVKELNCMYGISSIFEKPDLKPGKIFNEIAHLIQSSWQYPEVARAQIVLGENKYKTAGFKETIWNQESDIYVYGKREGSVKICYLYEKPECDQGPFLKEERDLIDAIAQRIGKYIEHQKAEKGLIDSEEKLRILSSHLMTAQEQERKRIAMDLHDDLGQSLAVLKLRLISMQNKLPEGLTEIKYDCESATEKLDQIIKKVRRLSSGLTPFNLDILGVTTSLKSMANDFSRHSHLKITFYMDNIDNIFSSIAEIAIYRIFQEIFTNIEKHSQADHVIIEIRLCNDSVIFIIEDNGKGFDTEKIILKYSNDRGIGLASMDERVRMLGGRFKIQSQLKEGTRIEFTLPIKK